MVAGATNDWPTFAHDDQRTGFQSQSNGITKSTVDALELHWSVALRQVVTASPIVAGGTVYISTQRGIVYALATDTGRERWHRKIGPIIRMTPALVDGRLLVGVYGVENTKPPHGASLQALDPETGRVLWKTPITNGVVRSEPIVIKGVIYEGVAGGDVENGCAPGRIVTLDEKTGKLLPDVWFTSPKRKNGGGIWSPLSFDGETIFFGTGNTCDGTGAQNSIVAITPALKTVWTKSANDPEGLDEDVGSGAMILGERTYTEGKSGVLYALDRHTGKAAWTGDLHVDAPGGGGHATPSGDGTVIVANSGDGTDEPSKFSKLVVFDTDGHELYTIDQQATNSPAMGASFVPGIGFAAIDKSFRAFDAHSGTTLWSYPTEDAFYAVPAIAEDRIYTVDLSGNVYAFALGTKMAKSSVETLAAPLHPEPPQMHYKRWSAFAAGVVVAAAALALVVRRRRGGRRRG